MPDISRRKNKYNTKRNDRYVDRSLPQKSSQDKYSYSTNKAANDIKNDVDRKTNSTSESFQNNNVANYRRGAQRKPYNKRRLDEDAKDIQWRAISGQNGTGVLHEREDGNKHPLDKAFDVGGKFISNFMDSVADYSPIGGAYTIATGKTLTGDAYKNNPYETQRQQGISSTLGRMAGMMTDYALMRSAFNPVLEKTAGAVLNGTKLGQAIKGSSVLGKIGQSVGSDALNKMTTGLVKETISDATLGFGQNALVNYGSGLRGSDFWKQQAIDTALDFGVGGAMEGIGIGKQIKNANTALKQMSAESVTDFLSGAKTKDEYIDALINRANEQMDIGYKEGIAPQLKKTASEKSNEFLEEAAKVDKMTPKQFNRYKLGRDLDENVKYYDATRGRTVKNAYEGDIETVKNTPVEEREKFGNRPKPDEEVDVNAKEEPEVIVKENNTIEEPEVVVKEKNGTIEEPENVIKEEDNTVKANDQKSILDNNADETITAKGEETNSADVKITEPNNTKPKNKEQKKVEVEEEAQKIEEEKPIEEPKPETETAEKTPQDKVKQKGKEPVTEDNGYKIGDDVEHTNYGKGKVVGFEERGRGKNKVVNTVIKFEKDGTERVIPHTVATQNGYLKHVNAELDSSIKPEANVEPTNIVETNVGKASPVKTPEKIDTRKPNMNMKFKTLLGLQDSEDKFKIIERKISRYNEDVSLRVKDKEGFEEAEKWYLDQRKIRSEANGQKSIEPEQIKSSTEGGTAGNSGTEGILQSGQGNDGVRRGSLEGRNEGEVHTGRPKSVLVSEEKQKILDTDKTIKEKTTQDYTDNLEEFNKLVDDNRHTHKRGYCVDLVDLEDLPEGSKFITTNDGTVTIGIKPKGTGADIVALSKSPKASNGTTTHEAFMTALALGGDRSDQYGTFLTKYYNDRYGLIPVAKVKYDENVIRMFSDPKEVDDKIAMFRQMEAEGNIPDVYISAKFDDLESTIKTRAEGGYKKITEKDLNKLPVFEGEDAYDRAIKYRDELLDNQAKREEFLAKRNKKRTKKTKGDLATKKDVAEAGETFSEDSLKKLTNAQLQSMCDDYKIEVIGTGKKGNRLHQDYVDAITKHFKKGDANLEDAVSKVNTAPETPAVADTAKTSKLKDTNSIKVGDFLVDDRYGVGKVVGFGENEYVGKTLKLEFNDDSFEVAVDKAGLHLSNYEGGGTPELGNMHKPKGETVTVNATTSATSGENASTTLSDGGTNTFTSTIDASGKPQKKPLKQLRRKAETPNLNEAKANAKAGNANAEIPKKQKPITSKSNYQDVESRFANKDTNRLFDEVEQFISEYKGDDTSKAIETFLRSDKVSPETKKIIMEMRENNEAFTKDVITNKSVLEEASRKINDDFDGTVASFFSKVKSGEQFTSQDMADGYNIAKRYMENGEFRKAAEVHGELATGLTENGRFLQSQRMWRSLTPEGRVSSTLSGIRRLEKSRGMKSGTIRIGEEGEKLLKAIYDAKTNKEIAQANKAFATYVWNQIPPTFAEKANAWRYLAMLGNPKTHIRNILGNTLFLPARITSDIISTGLERTLFSKRIKDLDGDVLGHHAILNRFNADDRARLKLADESFKDERDLLESITTKLYDRQRAEGSSTFKTKLLDFLEKWNSKLLDNEDVLFMGYNYRSAYAQYLKANKIKASDVTEEIAKKASAYAQDQALKATYRDANQLAEAFSKLRKKMNVKSSDDGLMKVGKAAGGFLMDSTIPFVKTPLNILKRGTLEYSPVGIGRGIGRFISPKNADELLKGIEYFSNGLTGTGVLGLGIYLANKGIINGSLGDWGKEKSYEQMLGKQDYSVTLSDETSITLDWVAPMSMPFFVGVEAASAFKDGVDIAQLFDALSNITDPIFEMSMLQGIENNFNMAFSDKRGLSTIAKNAGFNYLSQFVPTLAGQIARTRVKDRKTVVSTATNPLTKSVQKNLGKILNKVPIAGDVINQDYVDLWGRTDSKEKPTDYVASLLENMFSPAYIAKENQTEVDKEIQDLYSKLGEEDKEKILPSFSANAFKQKIDDREYNMTPAEYTQYQKTVGQSRYSGLKELFKTDKYKDASNDEKRKMIEEVYDEANAKGKKEYLLKVDEEYASAPDFYELTDSQREKYSEFLDMDKEDWAKVYRTMLDKSDEKKEETGKGSSADEKRFQLLESGVETYEQAQSFLGETTSEDKWNEAQEAYKDGKTLKDVEKEAKLKAEEEERQKNMTEEEKKFENYFKKNVSEKYDKKVVSQKLVDEYIARAKYADGQNDKNGNIRQSEARAALDSMTNLTRAQKAYLWSISNTWKTNPYN